MDNGRKMTRITISMDQDTKDRLKAVAYENRTTPSALIQNFIWRELSLGGEKVKKGERGKWVILRHR